MPPSAARINWVFDPVGTTGSGAAANSNGTDIGPPGIVIGHGRKVVGRPHQSESIVADTDDDFKS